MTQICEIRDDKSRVFLEVNETLEGIFDEKNYVYSTYRKPFFEDKVLRAWGFSPDIVAWLEDHGCKKVVIDLRDKKIATKFEHFKTAVRLSLNKDFGQQVFVAEKLWKDTK